MFRTSLVILLLSLALSGQAQSPVDWINYNQVYYKIPVAKEGIYKVSYVQLQQSGFPVESVDPRTLQIFHRGEEQAIRVSGEEDNQFNAHDYIEFYGIKNDGMRDTRLYGSPDQQPHTWYNLYSDTTAYFITFGASQGKRMQAYSHADDGSRTPQPYVLQENLLVLSEDYSLGVIEAPDVYSSNFDNGEGWCGYLIWQGFSRDYTISNITRTVITAPPPQLEIVLAGRSSTDHTVNVYVGSGFRLVGAYSVDGFNRLKVTVPLTWSDITADGKLPVRVGVENTGEADYVSLAALRLTYARAVDAEGGSELRVRTVPDASGKALLNIQNVQDGTQIFDITDRNNVSIVGATAAPGSLNAVIQDTQTSRTLFLSAQQLIPARVVPAKFRNFLPGQADFIIISHAAFRKPALGYSDPVKAYAEYRASDAGGSYDTLVVHSRDLYDQFNYGEVSNLAIREFLAYMAAGKKPSYLFIIGKGLELTYRYYRSPFVAGEYQDYVPTAGYPGSDMLFSVGIGGSGYAGGIPTGRLPATKPEHVAAYLNKIKETEALPYDDLWRKKILHLSGGIENWEPALFKNYMEQLQGIAEAPHMGALVEGIAKQSRDVQIINVSKQVNEGLSLITFLGHSSTSTLDFDIGYVSNPTLGYNNRGKYPMMIMNGCEVGSFFHKFRMFGEDWIIADKMGATGFMAHNAYGVLFHLMSYTRRIYEVAFNDEAYIGKGIGDIQLEAGKRFLETGSKIGPDYSQLQQTILLADPSLPVFGAKKPDLEVRSNNVAVVSLNALPVTATYDSFGIRMIIRNYGIVKPQLFKVQVERTLPDNSVMIYDSLFNLPSNVDTVVFTIRRKKEVPFGSNHFRITVDSDNIIDELNESNNEAHLDFVFQVNGTKNLYPNEFAIVNDVDIQLTFQATDIYAPARDYLLELDTVATFNSPFLKQHTVNGKVLGMRAVELVPEDTLAYYWRTRIANPGPSESGEWTTSSFTYIKDGGEGWAQVHFPQFQFNQSVGLVSDARRFSFQKSVLPVRVRTYGASAGKPWDSTSVQLDGTEYNMSTQGWGCRGNTINVIAFDRKSTYPYVGIDMKWYEVLYVYGRRMICGRQPFVINSFQWDEVSSDVRPDLIDYVNNIAEGDSVLLYSYGNAFVNLWPADAKAKVAEFGISLDQINSVASGEGVVIFGRKGAPPGTATVYRTTDPTPATGRLVVNKTISGGYTSGYLNAWVGPAYAWDKIVWNVSEKELQDNVTFNVFGQKANGEEVLLITGAASGTDLSVIDAAQYPTLRIQFYAEDNTFLTPAQLQHWLVHFTSVPEGVLLPLSSNEPVIVDEGQLEPRTFGFFNVSDRPFQGDVQVRYTLFNIGRNEGKLASKTITAPLPGDTTVFSIAPATIGMAGWNDFEVFANPRVVPERYYDNNLIQLKSNIFVELDRTAPVVDVTFDGRHINNGEFVSWTPKIQMTLWDENPYLLKQDTVGVKVFLAGPCAPGSDCNPVYVPFTNPQLKWFAATAENDFRLEYKPMLEPGEYTLMVEAADARGNKTVPPYKITFVVDDKSKIAFIEPFPNPFAAELFFGFSLAGKYNAQNMLFEVRDITGRKLYSKMSEIEVTPGVHEYYWPGKDNSGNLLGSGVYFVTYQFTVEGKQYIHQSKVVISR